MLAALALLIFGSLVLAGYALAMMLGARQEAKEALERRLATTIGLSDAARRGGVLKDRRLSTIAVVNTFLSRPGIATSMIRMVAGPASRSVPAKCCSTSPWRRSWDSCS